MTYRAECISCKCDHSPNGSRYLTHSQITSRRSNLEKRIQWDDPLGEFSILKDMKKTLKNLNQVQIKMFEQVIEHQNMPICTFNQGYMHLSACNPADSKPSSSNKSYNYI